MILKRPESDHHYENLIIGNDGNNVKGLSWLDHGDDFVTANALDLMRFHSAPNHLSFRIYSIHFYAMTVHVTNKATSQDRPGEINLDMNLDALNIGKDTVGFTRKNHIAHCRLYLWKCDNLALVHDADDDDTYDAATDHWNPFNNREVRTYDPDPHWIFPNGIDIGPYLGFIVAHGGRKNMEDYTGGESFFHCLIEYSLVKRQDYHKVFGR